MKAPLSIAAVFLLAACASARAAVPTLQSLDRMGSLLKGTTARSAVVSQDVVRLERVVAGANVDSERRLTARLKRDALLMSVADGRVALGVRSLARRESNRTVRHFYWLVSGSLTWQWWEAWALRRLADQVWSDPLSVRPGSYARELELSRRARWRAEVASRLANRAMRWRSTHSGAFRYTPAH